MDLKRELTTLLNRTSRENKSDTPDFLLAEFMLGCLESFERATKKRDKWYRFEPWDKFEEPLDLDPQHPEVGPEDPVPTFDPITKR